MKHLEIQHEIMAEELWLKHYNTVLFEKNLITVEQRDKMILAIENRCSRRIKQLKAI